MGRRLTLIILVVGGIGFLDTSSFLAQQAAGKRTEATASRAKPCIVVLGAVRSAAVVEIRRQVRLSEVLAIAGGITERAGGSIRLIHSGSQCFRGTAEELAAKSVPADAEKVIILNLQDLLHGDKSANLLIEAGDVVIVTQVDPVYILGEVISPREIYLTDSVTLMQAIKIAGGLRADAKGDKVMIYRPNGNLVEHITIVLNEVRKNRTKDPILQPRDIVYVGSPILPAKRYPTFDPRPLIPKTYRVIY